MLKFSSMLQQRAVIGHNIVFICDWLHGWRHDGFPIVQSKPEEAAQSLHAHGGCILFAAHGVTRYVRRAKQNPVQHLAADMRLMLPAVQHDAAGGRRIRQKGLFIHNTSARGIYQQRIGLDFLQESGIAQMVSGKFARQGQRRMERYDIGFPRDLFQGHETALRLRQLARRVIAQHTHSFPFGHGRH